MEGRARKISAFKEILPEDVYCVISGCAFLIRPGDYCVKRNVKNKIGKDLG